MCPSAVVTNLGQPNQHLNEWFENIRDLLELVDKTCHLIQRERMVSAV